MSIVKDTEDKSLEEIFLNEEILVFEIPKFRIDALDFTNVDALMKQFEANPKSYRGSLLVIMPGYEDIIEELYEISEVRTYVTELFKRYPYFYYYVNVSPENHVRHILLSCLADVEVFFEGELKTTNQLWEEGYRTFDQLPKHELHLSMDKATWKRIDFATYMYGKKVGDIQGANKVIRALEPLVEVQ